LLAPAFFSFFTIDEKVKEYIVCFCPVRVSKTKSRFKTAEATQTVFRAAITFLPERHPPPAA